LPLTGSVIRFACFELTDELNHRCQIRHDWQCSAARPARGSSVLDYAVDELTPCVIY